MNGTESIPEEKGQDQENKSIYQEKYIINHQQGRISPHDLILMLADVEDPVDILVRKSARGSRPFDDPIISGQIFAVVEEDTFMMWDINGSERERVLLNTGDIMVISCVNRPRRIFDLGDVSGQLRTLERGDILPASEVGLSLDDAPAEDMIRDLMNLESIKITVYDGPASRGNDHMRSDEKKNFALSKKRYLSPHRPIPRGISYRASLDTGLGRDFLEQLMNKPRLRIYRSSDHIIDDLRAIVGISDELSGPSFYDHTFEVKTDYSRLTLETPESRERRKDTFREVMITSGDDSFEDIARYYIMCYILDMNGRRTDVGFEHLQIEELYRFISELNKTSSGPEILNDSPILHIKHLMDIIIKRAFGTSKGYLSDLADKVHGIVDKGLNPFSPLREMGFIVDHGDYELSMEITLPAQYPEENGEYKRVPLAIIGFRADVSVSTDSTERRTEMFLRMDRDSILQGGESGPQEKLLLNLEETSNRTIKDSLDDLDSLFETK